MKSPPPDLSGKAGEYLRALCVDLPSRRVGSPGNRAATDLFARATRSFGFESECPAFSCFDWSSAGASLRVEGERFDAQVSPYSPGCDARAPLVVAASLAELETCRAAGKILLLRGELTREPLMPKNFTFYNPEEHQRIVRLLEAQSPAAIVTASGRNPEMAGALYPFPVIEDGDFEIPSVYLNEDSGARLAGLNGKTVELRIQAERVPASGCNVIARKGRPEGRIVFVAHIDAKDGSPGALDNAGGIASLLLLAELLSEYRGTTGIELVAMNGEDHYANPGEMQYLRANMDRFDQVRLAVNIDGVGDPGGGTAWSLYDCPPVLAAPIESVLAGRPGLVRGQPWPQGDHSLFLMNGRPAVAFTSERAFELLASVIHTGEDRPDRVDPAILAGLALALRDLTLRLDESHRPG